MSWLKHNKWLSVTLVITGGMTGAASASWLPGALNSGSIFGSGGGSFYDYESTFSSGGDIGSIFNDGLNSIESILSGNNGGIVSPCGLVIMNFAPDDGCGSSGGSYDQIIFDTVFESVSKELGIPNDITGVITGRRSVEDIFETVLQEELEQLGIPIPSGVLGQPVPVIGQQGILDPDNLLEELLKASRNQGGEIDVIAGRLPSDDSTPGERAISIFTPGVNTSLMQPVIALDLLTKSVTDRGLSAKGQEITTARTVAAQSVSRASGKLGEASMQSAEQQLAAAVSMNGSINEQTSTQDTLKAALTGMTLLQAQATQLEAQANSQRALSAQMDNLNLQATHEMRDGVFTNGISLGTINEQLLQNSHREMAEQSSVRSENAVNLRMLGAMR